ncbi:uncharacterized protein LOC142543591 [Primulina tabacum]|uniref:uncharacterized protein LOC142543591 n=1 Tax=Primulina tabacum TaxID=48773 RepID=UPI003F5A9612
MAMDTQRSRALHNFSFPGGLRWGNQRSLRCIKVDCDSQGLPLREFASDGSDSSGHRHHQDSSQLRHTTGGRGREKGSPDSDFVFLGSIQMDCTPPQVTHGGWGIGDDEGNGVTAVRENVMFDRPKAADESKLSIFKEGGEVSVSPQSVTPHPAAMSVGDDTNRPWNLRKRRAACKTPASEFAVGVNGVSSCPGVGGKGMREDGARPSSEISLIKGAAAAVTGKSLRSGSNGCGEKRKREKFSVALSKREIEEDFLTFTGHKPLRRPKKRAKNVLRQLDTLFPGLWLTEITPELYKVSGEAAP